MYHAQVLRTGICKGDPPRYQPDVLTCADGGILVSFDNRELLQIGDLEGSVFADAQRTLLEFFEALVARISQTKRLKMGGNCHLARQPTDPCISVL